MWTECCGHGVFRLVSTKQSVTHQNSYCIFAYPLLKVVHVANRNSPLWSKYEKVNMVVGTRVLLDLGLDQGLV